MNVNPKEVIARGIISTRDGSPIPEECIQQIGVDLRLLNEVTINPCSFVNTEFYEKFDMQDTFGKPTIRSSFSRKGIFISSGEYDPGFNNFGGVSIYNLSDSPVTIPAMTRIAQMVVQNANTAKMYDGFYNKNNTIESQYEKGFKND